MVVLRVNKDVLTLFSGNNISVLNLCNNKLLHLKNSFVSKKLCSSDPYLGLTRFCAALSDDGRLYAVADGRDLIVWSTTDWLQKCVKVLERSASKITFMPSNDHIVVADKTGDVYIYSLFDDSNAKGSLLLGHISILLDLCITPDQKFIITCDRDEKIRVSHYPNSYNIQTFCLGHSAFVTRVVLFTDHILLSSSGDGTLKFWNYLNGNCLATHLVSSDLDGDCSQECIITNLVVHPSNVICLSVHKFDGILVYKCNNFKLTRIQIIDCLEPLDFVLNDNSLWILNPSPQPFSVMFWDERNCRFLSDDKEQVKSVINLLCKECSYITNYSYIDLSVLHKKLEMKEKVIDTCKKLKT